MGPDSAPPSTAQPADPVSEQVPPQEASACPRQRSSLRQANRGTFQRMLAQKLQEDQDYAEFERAAEARLRRGKRPAPQPAQPAVAPAAAAAAAASGGLGPDGGVVVKKRRGRPPKPRPPEPPKPRLMGTHLEAVLARVRGAVDGSGMAPGTPVWVKVTGYCAWPALIWTLELCARSTWADVITNYEPGKLLVRFYGEHSSSWVAPKQLLAWDESEVQHKSEALTHWGKKNAKLKLVSATLDELAARSEDPDEEAARIDRLGRQYQLDVLQAAARHRHSSLLRPTNSEAAPPDEGLGGGGVLPAVAGATATAAAAAAAAAAGGSDEARVTGNAWGTCDVCREEVPDMRCGSCHRWLHALCGSPAALTASEYPADQHWTCPCCGADNTVKVLPEEELLRQAAGQGVVAERMGLTPDWIISTTAFSVFQLPRPTADQPYIAGLLDPACNNKLEPNIPAEVLYDKHDDGLDPTNTWKGYYVLLNPDYRAQVQWRFVNRAIDEVENGNVPAVLLVCRNSTDTAYFQRLRPYPRVLLRRCNTQFKDYDKCPIGFGVVVFCIATAAHKDCLQLYERFYKGFSPFGEPNIPVDTEFLGSSAFYQLLSRLRVHAEQHARDHWAQCTKCGVWRIISWQQQQALSNGTTTDWTCSMLRPPLTSCATPQSKRELTGLANSPEFPPQQQQQPQPTLVTGAGRTLTAPAAAGLPHTHSSDAAAAYRSAADEAEGGAAARAAAALPGLYGCDGLGSCPPGLPAATGCSTEGSSPGGCSTPPAAQEATPPGHCLAEGTPDGGSRGFAAADCSTGTAAPRSCWAGPAVSQGTGATGAEVPPAQAGAAGLLAAFAAEAVQLQRDVAAAYLCKSAAGQVSIRQAHALLDAAMGVSGPGASKHGSNSRGSGRELQPAAAAAADAGCEPASGSASYIQGLVGLALPHRQQLGRPEPFTAAHRQQQQQQQQLQQPMQAAREQPQTLQSLLGEQQQVEVAHPMQVDGEQQQPQQQQQQEEEEAGVQDIQQQLLQVAAGRPPKRPCLSWTLPQLTGRAGSQAVAAGGAGGGRASTCARGLAAGSTGSSGVDSNLLLSSSSLGLSVLAPAVVRLVRQWMLHLVQQLVVLRQQQQDQQQLLEVQEQGPGAQGDMGPMPSAEPAHEPGAEQMQLAAAAALADSQSGGSSGALLQAQQEPDTQQQQEPAPQQHKQKEAKAALHRQDSEGQLQLQPPAQGELLGDELHPEGEENAAEEQQLQQLTGHHDAQAVGTEPAAAPVAELGQGQISTAAPQPEPAHSNAAPLPCAALGTDSPALHHAPPAADNGVPDGASAAAAQGSGCPTHPGAVLPDAALQCLQQQLTQSDMQPSHASAAAAAHEGQPPGAVAAGTPASAAAGPPVLQPLQQHLANRPANPGVSLSRAMQPGSGTAASQLPQSPASPVTPVRPYGMLLPVWPPSAGLRPSVGLPLPWGLAGPQLLGQAATLQAPRPLSRPQQAAGPAAAAGLASGTLLPVQGRGRQGLVALTKQQQQLVLLQLLARCRPQLASTPAASAAAAACTGPPNPLVPALLPGTAGVAVQAQPPAAGPSARDQHAAAAADTAGDASAVVQQQAGLTSAVQHGGAAPAATLPAAEAAGAAVGSVQAGSCAAGSAAACRADAPDTPPAVCGVAASAAGQRPSTAFSTAKAGGQDTPGPEVAPPVAANTGDPATATNTTSAGQPEPLGRVLHGAGAGSGQDTQGAGAAQSGGGEQAPSQPAVAAASSAAAASGLGAAKASSSAAAESGAAAPVKVTSPGAGRASAAAMTPPPMSGCAAGLRPHAVWDLTPDRLLRAVLLEQPCLMEALLALLGSMAAAHHSAIHAQKPGALLQGAPTAASSDGDRGPAPAAAAAALSGPARQSSAAAADAGSSPAAAAAGVCGHVDANLLDALCSQPMLTGCGAWPKRPTGQQQQQQEVADGDEGCDEGEEDAVGVAAPDSSAEEFEMMSSLELARAARVAANKAYMMGLGLGPTSPAAAAGLPPTDAAVVAAARRLAQQAAVQRAKRQLDASSRLLDARRRARRQQERRLRATLEALAADEAAAAQQVAAARMTLQDVQEEAGGM